MIPRTIPALEVQPTPDASLTWQQQLSGAIDDVATLAQRLQLPDDWLAGMQTGNALFKLRVPEAYLRRIALGDPHDPLLAQVLPSDLETHTPAGFVTDPLAESAATATPGIIHKYAGRVLLILGGACAINCRYCFRRHFPYDENRLQKRDWLPSLDYLRERPDIHEVILSGGDPLAVSDRYLAELITELEGIPHLRRLRIHTRLPVVIPDRVTDALTHRLSHSRLKPVVVLHINHPNEIDAAVRSACKRFRDGGIPLLNQAVLLKNINDSVTTLTQLSETLFDAGVLPYYLHLLDRVQGAAHFLISDDDARTLYAALLGKLPGYLVPRLMREVPGASSKLPISL